MADMRIRTRSTPAVQLEPLKVFDAELHLRWKFRARKQAHWDFLVDLARYVKRKFPRKEYERCN